MRLKSDEPSIVLVPISSSAINTPINAIANAGVELPNAINVAPAMSGGRLNAIMINNGHLLINK